MRPVLPQPTSMLPERFAFIIIAGLCQALAARCVGNPFIAPIGLLLWGPAQRWVAKLRVLFVRWCEGCLTAARPVSSHNRPKRARGFGLGLIGVEWC